MLDQAKALLDSDPDECYRLCQQHLTEHPDSHAAYTLCGVVNYRVERYGAALAFFSMALKYNAKQPELWNWLGTCWHELRRPEEARECFLRALQLRQAPQYMTAMAATYSDEGDQRQALRWIDKAEALQPGYLHAKQVSAFAHLALGDWRRGWEAYKANLGGKFRKMLQFGDAADWGGQPVKRLIVYGEQGLGDEIMFASCIPDISGVEQLVIECDGRLEGLYRRSFPRAEVHGTRRSERDWDIEADAQIACGDLPALYRPSPQSCPRTPYLTADPERRLMWRALFKSWGKPVIGIAWSGGRSTAQASKRAMGLEAFRPLIESRPDAVFVSLQYKDPSDEIEATGLPVRHFGALLSDDYDDTAALVAELDEIIGVHTTVHHLAGALGKASTIFVPEAPLWNYAQGDRLPWYAAQTFVRQRKGEQWADTVRRYVAQQELKAAA